MQRGATVALGAAIIAVACTGTARAYWSGHGGGIGASATGTIALTVSTTPVAGLYPGSSIAVTVTLKNTSAAGNLAVTSLSQSGTATIQTAGKGTCNPAVVSFAVGTLPVGSLAPNQTATASGTVSMTSAAADGCQGATFAIPLIATGGL
jgi:hypothetical protein